ncbi:uncharacterized protein LOC120141802 [Hibiscus syriacus]|uniref:uncharacterized protein LOC120141802 n=1 Tax=Hibiscus syriacus TaxID=106335 RepID=UPI0019205D3E|nr:uncharacterized protein LOC120141802 [Hibiscus syriacus]
MHVVFDESAFSLTSSTAPPVASSVILPKSRSLELVADVIKLQVCSDDVCVEPVTTSLMEDLVHKDVTGVVEGESSSLNFEVDQNVTTDGGDVEHYSEELNTRECVDSNARSDVEAMVNHHPTLTISKYGVFKPKVYSFTYDTIKPVNVHEALQSPYWKNIVYVELEALRKNCTWSLVPLPEGRGWQLREANVNNVFLHGDLRDDVFIQQPPGFEQRAPDGTVLIEEVVKLLGDEIALKDLGELRFFLGIEVKRCGEALILSQRKFILELLKKTKMHNARVVSTPMLVTLKITHDAGDLLSDTYEYRSIVEALLYVFHTRPDISFNVNKVAQYMHAPRHKYFVTVK